MQRSNSTDSYFKGWQFSLFFLKSPKPILIGHNVQNYDIPVSVKLTKYDSVEQFRNGVSGFIDTLEPAKKIWKRSHDDENYEQETLIRSILKIDYDAFNAVVDVTLRGNNGGGSVFFQRCVHTLIRCM